MRWLLAVACLMVSAVGHADVSKDGENEVLTSSKVFSEIPLEVLDMIRPSSRLDMLDYYSQADSLLTVADALGGSSRIELVTDDYMKVSVTPVSTLEIKLLPYKKSQIVMTLYTTGGDDAAKDTEVCFFDSGLNPLPTDKFLKSPEMKSFFNLKNSEVSEKELEETVPFEAVEYSIGPDSTSLKATFTTLNALSKDTQDLLSPLLIPLLAASWTGQFKFK